MCPTEGGFVFTLNPVDWTVDIEVIANDCNICQKIKKVKISGYIRMHMHGMAVRKWFLKSLIRSHEIQEV